VECAVPQKPRCESPAEEATTFSPGAGHGSPMRHSGRRAQPRWGEENLLAPPTDATSLT
jgi:hypothetical protein